MGQLSKSTEELGLDSYFDSYLESQYGVVLADMTPAGLATMVGQQYLEELKRSFVRVKTGVSPFSEQALKAKYGDWLVEPLDKRCKHTREEINEMRRLKTQGMSYRQLAKRFGYRSPSTVSKIIHGLCWKNRADEIISL